ncbi:hypothetical protein BB559_000139 [Furculomyces boomerangus]|uniref:Ribosomal protein L19 n=2 Tax=Harpellales TaxID=61421 RepID=A0A2T9Z674_9FUNG|nr:hypothetical protein BB559_000139 [Furculomyces boomerangus]PVZ99687.1 hypothetical protein BB558_004285 [Smittium angustum]
MIGIRNILKQRVLTAGRYQFHSWGVAKSIPASVIVPEKEIPEPILLKNEKKINVLNVIKREALERANHDGRALLFRSRAPMAERMCPGDAVIVESSNNLTNPEFTTRFIGICIAINRRGIDTSFTLRNVILKVGVEMKFKAFSPLVRKIEVLRKGKGFRRAKLYYLRDRSGSILKTKAAKQLTEAYNASQK